MTYKAGTVRLDKITADDETYRITTRGDADSLVVSIATSGLINPPILLKITNKPYRIICGFRRIRACLKLGWEQVDARLLAADTPSVRCAQIAIADNAFGRNLNPVEISRAINLLSADLDDEAAIAEAAGKAGLPLATADVTRLRSLTSLPQRFQAGVIAETLSLPMAKRLQQMEAEDAETVFELFSEIRAGLNVQREILDHAQESALREGVSLRKVITGDDVMQIRNDPDLQRPHKTALIRKTLKFRRYPVLTATEERFNRRVGELGLPGNMKLVPPAGFEGPDYSLILKFRSREQLDEQKKTIERLLTSDALRKILD